MRADGGEGGTVEPRHVAGDVCESCGRHRATEALQRRPSRHAEIREQRIDHQVRLCYQCWLDILCGLAPMPPEHAVVSALGTSSRLSGRSAWVVRVACGAPGEHLQTPSREFRELAAAYASILQAHGAWPGGP